MDHYFSLLVYFAINCFFCCQCYIVLAFERVHVRFVMCILSVWCADDRAVLVWILGFTDDYFSACSLSMLMLHVRVSLFFACFVNGLYICSFCWFLYILVKASRSCQLNTQQVFESGWDTFMDILFSAIFALLVCVAPLNFNNPKYGLDNGYALVV